MSPVERIFVSLDFDDTSIPVGTLLQKDKKIYFKYENEFLKSNLDISPYKLTENDNNNHNLQTI